MKNADTPASESTEDSLKSRASIGQAGFYRMPANALTKREKAAFRAMQGLLSSQEAWVIRQVEMEDYGRGSIAKLAVQHADALLAELERTS